MDLQLELLPYYYYNTLGFEQELIDYVKIVSSIRYVTLNLGMNRFTMYS